MFPLNPACCSLGMCKAAWSVLKVHVLKLEQLKKKKGGKEMELSSAQIRRSVTSSRKRGLPRSNPPLMERVQPECQEQPQAADFQSRLTTNPLPKKQPGSSGIMKPAGTATGERGTANQMETPNAAL